MNNEIVLDNPYRQFPFDVTTTMPVQVIGCAESDFFDLPKFLKKETCPTQPNKPSAPPPREVAVGFLDYIN